MTSVDSLTNTPVASATTQATTTKDGSIAGDFDRFLLLLTTQLQNQDPLSPMDATQFTTQLVQFSQVEQSVNMNKYLSDLVDLQISDQMQSAFGYVGQTVDVLSDEVPLQDGQAELFYAVSGKPTAVALQILDANGKTVRTIAGTTDTGIQRIEWDGRDSSGNTLKDGTYTLKLIAEDADGVTLSAQTGYTGGVSEVTNVNSQMQLNVNGLQIPMTEIVAVRKTAAEDV